MTRPDTWHHLKDHETVPPPELRERLLLLLDTFSDDHAADNEAMLNRAQFQRLLEHPIPPPPVVTATITSGWSRTNNPTALPHAEQNEPCSRLYS